MGVFRKILVAIDFSEHSEAALQLAAKLATDQKAELHLLHVHHPPMYLTPMDPPTVPTGYWLDVRAAAERAIADKAASLDVPVPVQCDLVEGSPDHEIAHFAAEAGADLIMMGTRGHSGLSHVLLGSVAERTLRHAPCPVLVVRSDDATAN